MQDTQIYMSWETLQHDYDPQQGNIIASQVSTDETSRLYLLRASQIWCWRQVNPTCVAL